MTSEVEICNLALSHIRARSINSLTETSLEAQQCKLKYEPLRDFLLRDAPWNFAQRIEPLALTTKEVFNWVYVYQYPSSCLHVNRLILNYEEFTANDGAYRARHIEDIYTPDLGRQVKYRKMNVDGSLVIVANEPDLRIDYRSRVTNPNLFDPTFILALSHLLAAELAMAITGGDTGRKLRSDELQIYQSYIDAAVASDLNESYDESVDSEFITIRR